MKKLRLFSFIMVLLLMLLLTYQIAKIFVLRAEVLELLGISIDGYIALGIIISLALCLIIFLFPLSRCWRQKTTQTTKAEDNKSSEQPDEPEKPAG